MRARANGLAAWTCGLGLLAAGAMLIGLQLSNEAIVIISLNAQGHPALFKLVLGAEAFGLVFASALLMITVRDLPRRRRLGRRREAMAATAA